MQKMKAEEDKTGKGDYTVWKREQHEDKSKPLLIRIKEKLSGEEALPTEQEHKDFTDYGKKVSDRLKQSKSTSKPLGPMKAEEDALPSTPQEKMEGFKPKKTTPTFIDTKPSGKGKSLKEWASEDDMLVYPDEYKMGMKEETEHSDVVGKDKEALKKIVLAHLKEDSHYYTKLGTVMKAEETTPGNKPLQTPKPSDKIKARLGNIKSLKRQLEGVKKKAEEDETSDYIQSLSKRKTPGWTAPKGPKPKTESDLPSERLSAEEGKEVNLDDFNELYQFIRWMTDKGFKADDKDKLKQYIHQYDVEKFAEKSEAEEKMAPAKFHAEPEEKV